MRFYTRSGDDGLTSLIGGEQVPKSDIRVEMNGTLDEINSIIGVARNICKRKETQEILLRIQQDLSIIMGEIASTGGLAKSKEGIDSSTIDWVEEQIEHYSAQVEPSDGFIIPGDSLPSAVLDVVRTFVRRAERQVVILKQSGYLRNEFLLKYLNRLSSLCYVIELHEIQRLKTQFNCSGSENSM
ncbi:MAG: cob(I)yrinic acid a,c-diamide adenosyltransferase [Anaerolineaceae bacterium]|nr:cob(I)yrinic acid a,c-diamide adenosyltransferase [Anaerolineaceae bacterium]